jgi:hypothetical protein
MLASAPRASGGGGIRTLEHFRVAGFQDRCNRPLCHPSEVCSSYLGQALCVNSRFPRHCSNGLLVTLRQVLHCGTRCLIHIGAVDQAELHGRMGGVFTGTRFRAASWLLLVSLYWTGGLLYCDNSVARCRIPAVPKCTKIRLPFLSPGSASLGSLRCLRVPRDPKNSSRSSMMCGLFSKRTVLNATAPAKS